MWLDIIHYLLSYPVFLNCYFFTKELSRILILAINRWINIKSKINSRQSQKLIVVKEKMSNLIKLTFWEIVKIGIYMSSFLEDYKARI